MSNRRTNPPRRSSRPPSPSSQSTSIATASSPYIPAPPRSPSRPSNRRLSDFRRSQDISQPRRRSPDAPSSPHRRPRHSQRSRPHSLSHEKHNGRLTLLLSKYNTTSSGWHVRPVTLSPRSSDIEAWTDIRNTFRDEIQGVGRRLFGLKRVKYIMPITYTANGIPMRPATSPERYALGHAFMHAYRHPERLNGGRAWVGWFEEFAEEHEGEVGLVFMEGLWAEKLVGVGVVLTAAIIIVSAVWCARGGDLQTVFTVMSFVLGGITAELALVALYFQVTSSG